jgi:hypothetical protein
MDLTLTKPGAIPPPPDYVGADTATPEISDPKLLVALRAAENGGPGREMGVLSVPAPDMSSQLRVAAQTIQNVEQRYAKDTGQQPTGPAGYTDDFLKYFSQGGPSYRGYAPIGAPNDPTGLNVNHLPNLTAAYRRATTAAGPAGASNIPPPPDYVPSADTPATPPGLSSVAGINAGLKSAREWFQPAANNLANLLTSKFPDDFMPGGARAGLSLTAPPELQRRPESAAGQVAADVLNVVPPDLPSAGAQLGTLLGPTPLLRVGLGALGAGGGKALEPGASMEDILKSAGLTGLITGGLEGAGALGSKILRSVPNNPLIGGKRNIAEQAAATYGRQMGETVPELAGATTSERLRELASGSGRAALGASKEQTIQRIEGATGPGFTIDVQGTPMSLREANDALSAIGAKAFSRNPLERTVNGVDQRQLYGAVAQDIEQGLAKVSAPVLDLWQNAQQMYRQGMSYLKPLMQGSAYQMGPSGAQLNTTTLQKLFSTPKGEAAYRRGLGEEAFDALRDALSRGAPPGAVDRLAPGTGGALDPLLQSLQNSGSGLTSPILGILKGLLPNLGSTYAGAAGRAPYAVPPLIQKLADMYGQRLPAE